jgi:copper(I)-binding protein
MSGIGGERCGEATARILGGVICIKASPERPAARLSGRRKADKLARLHTRQGNTAMNARSLFLFLLCTAAPAWAQVEVKEPWVRATVAQQKATGAFMRLTAAQDARLVAVRSPVAGVAEIHEMALVDNVMRMRAVAAVDLPAGRTVELKPGGYHVMLMDLKQQVKTGETVPLTLVFESRDGKRQEVQVDAPVRPLAGGHGAIKH